MIQQLRSLAKLPWPIVWREVFADRHAVSGDLRLTVWDWRRPPSRAPERAVALTSDALSELSTAGQGFGELVTSHLRFVVAVDDVTRQIGISPRAFIATFDESVWDARTLAARLVWAATAVRLGHNAMAAGRELNAAGARVACREAQRRFLQQFGDWEEWVARLDPEAPTTEL